MEYGLFIRGVERKVLQRSTLSGNFYVNGPPKWWKVNYVDCETVKVSLV